MQRHRYLCPADSLLGREKDDHECQHREPMCGENDHIRQTAKKQAHNQIYLPDLHSLTGCDTVPCMFGIGKATGLNELMGGHDLIELGQQGAYEDKLTSKATSFVAAC